MQEKTDQIKAYIESDALTAEQRRVCYQSGSFVVRACPGSGKTRTVGTRLAWRIANWQNRRAGIATLSFTNVACEEISRQLSKLGLPPKPSWPHFLGTIDSFVNQFIFLPFGHTVMRCKRRPEIVHEHNSEWVKEATSHGMVECYRNGCFATSFHYLPDGSLRWCGSGKNQPTHCGQTYCARVKGAMDRKGFALFQDAMYWGMRVLEQPDMAAVIAARFPEIIIDEVQDTYETQVRIVSSLLLAGSKVSLVGDPDQAIYEYAGARPELFSEFERQYPVLPLSANFRSSQLICNATRAFSSLGVASPAKGEWKDYPAKPVVMTYRVGSEAKVVAEYLQLLATHAVDTLKSVALARQSKMVSMLSGEPSVSWPKGVGALAKALGKAASLREKRLPGEAHRTLMHALLHICYDQASYGPDHEAIKDIGYRQWRRKSWMLLESLPSPNQPLSEWLPKARTAVEDFLREAEWPCRVDLPHTLKRCSHPDAARPVSTFVPIPARTNKGLTIKTIHQAKGETYDAVMVVCGSGSKRRLNDLSQWLEPQVGEEERRVGYVAMTRPRRLLVVAVPDLLDMHQLVGKLGPHFVVESKVIG